MPSRTQSCLRVEGAGQVDNLLTHRKWPRMEGYGGERSDGLPTESRRYGRLENLRYDPGKPERSEMRSAAAWAGQRTGR